MGRDRPDGERMAGISEAAAEKAEFLIFSDFLTEKDIPQDA